MDVLAGLFYLLMSFGGFWLLTRLTPAEPHHRHKQHTQRHSPLHDAIEAERRDLNEARWHAIRD